MVAKRDLNLATKIEEAMRKNESLEAITKESVRSDITRNQITEQRRKNKNLVTISKVKDKSSSRTSSGNTRSGTKSGKQSPPVKPTTRKGITVSKSVVKSSRASSLRKASSENKQTGKRGSVTTKSTNSKLSVVGFRGRNSPPNKKQSL